MGDTLGEVMVAVLADVSPFTDEFSDAITDAGEAAADELTGAMEEAGEQVTEALGEAGVEAGADLAEGVTDGVEEIDLDLTDDLDAMADQAAEGGQEAGAGLVDQLDGELGAGDFAATIYDQFDGVDSDLAGVGQDAGDAFTEAVEGAVDGLHVDATGSFDSVTDEAQSAASDVVEAFAGVGEEVAGELDAIGESAGASMTAVGAGIGAAGVAGEAFVRSQQDMTVSVANTASALGMTDNEVRGLATSLTNATFPLDEAVGLLELGRQRGVEGADALGDYASFWDTVGDATGQSSQELAKAGVSLQQVGIAAGDEGEALAAFGFITDHSTASVTEFLKFTGKVGKELGDQTPSVDEMAAALGALEAKGLNARNAQAELQAALKETDGDMEAALAITGVTGEEYAAMTAKVEESSDVIQRNADNFADSRTPMQAVQSTLGDLAFRFSATTQVAGMLSGPLTAVGASMVVANQASQLLAGGMGTRLLAGLQGAAAGFKTLSVAILSNPIFLIGAVVIALGLLIWKFRDEILAALGSALDWLKDTFGPVFTWVKDTAVAAFESVVSFLSEFPGKVIAFLLGLVEWIIAHHPLVILWNLAVEWTPKVLRVAGDLVRDLIGWFLHLHDRARRLISDMVEAIIGFVRDLWTRWANLVQRIRDFIVDAFVWLKDKAVGAVRGLYDGAVAILTGMLDWVGELPGRIVRRLGNLASTLYNSGKDMIQGLMDGAKSLLSNIGRFFLDLLPSWIRKPFKKALGIDSPSKVFAGYGSSLVEGLVDGVASEQDKAIQVIEDFANDVSSAMDMGAVVLEPVVRPVLDQSRLVVSDQEMLVGVGANLARQTTTPPASNLRPLMGDVTIVSADPLAAGDALMRKVRNEEFLSGRSGGFV